jgi:signal peptidase I
LTFGRFAQLCAIAAAATLALRALVGEPIYIATPSMEPTLRVGDHVLLDKVTFRLREPQRGEIVVFHSPLDGKRDLVKRVIGVPGDTIEIRNKAVLVNGQALDEPYAVHDRAGEALKGDNLGPLTVPPLGLFVLGDNRDESNDSSVWIDPKSGEPKPFLERDDVLGLVRGGP